MYIQLQKGRKRRLLLAIFFSHFHMTLRFSLRSIKESNILIHPLLHSQTPNAGYHEGDAGLAKHGYENVGWAEQGYREDSRVPDPEAAEGPLLLGRPRKALRHLSWGSAEGKGDTEIVQMMPFETSRKCQWLTRTIAFRLKIPVDQLAWRNKYIVIRNSTFLR